MDFRAYLNSERLFTETPYEQTNLLSKGRVVTVPEKVVFDNFYRSRKEKIYCHICGGHRHLNGITGLVNGVDRILFGSSCAKDFFGPEITRLCSSDLRRRTKRAFDRFVIMEISNSIEPIENWLKSYRHLITHIESSWTDIQSKHQQAITSLLNHLFRNSGRLVETSHVSLGGNARTKEHFEQHSILTRVSSSDAIPTLTQLSQRLTLVEAFVYAVRSVNTEPTEQMFANLAAMHKKTLDAAQSLDASINFTADFFRPDKLVLLASWMETKRRARLSHLSEITKQNLAPNLRKIMGAGIEQPACSLSDAIGATEITEKLQRRRAQQEIKEVSVV